MRADARFDDLLGRLDDGDSKDRFGQLLERGMQELIAAELTARIGARLHERTDPRTNQRNGSRSRKLSTLAGDIERRPVESRSSDVAGDRGRVQGASFSVSHTPCPQRAHHRGSQGSRATTLVVSHQQQQVPGPEGPRLWRPAPAPAQGSTAVCAPAIREAAHRLRVRRSASGRGPAPDASGKRPIPKLTLLERTKVQAEALVPLIRRWRIRSVASRRTAWFGRLWGPSPRVDPCCDAVWWFAGHREVAIADLQGGSCHRSRSTFRTR